MEQDFLRRLEDLAGRCDRAGILTHTSFLTPAEQAQAAAWLKRLPGCRHAFSGGMEDCERKVLFFLPDWMEEPEPESELDGIALKASFGTPGHRDYLGALLALGVKREWLGDLRVDGENAWLVCLNTVTERLLELEQAGRVSVKAERIPLSEIPAPVYHRKQLRFTVQSLRLDAVLGELFQISRTAAAKKIAEGAASLNYLPCLKPDMPVGEGDVISLRGMGKGVVTGLGGKSKKDRQYVYCERFL